MTKGGTVLLTYKYKVYISYLHGNKFKSVRCKEIFKAFYRCFDLNFAASRCKIKHLYSCNKGTPPPPGLVKSTHMIISFE